MQKIENFLKIIKKSRNVIFAQISLITLTNTSTDQFSAPERILASLWSDFWLFGEYIFLQLYSSQMSSKFEVVSGLTNMPKYFQDLKLVSRCVYQCYKRWLSKNNISRFFDNFQEPIDLFWIFAIYDANNRKFSWKLSKSREMLILRKQHV